MLSAMERRDQNGGSRSFRWAFRIEVAENAPGARRVSLDLLPTTVVVAA
jgi:hypothetical protein